MTITPLIAGNWKMNGTRASLAEVEDLLLRLETLPGAPCDILICPPATLLMTLAQAVSETAVKCGGQDCHSNEQGAHTGDISAAMLTDAGASHVIVGHSERRSDHHEDDGRVRDKASAAIDAGLSPIICVGETEAQRDAGQANDVVSAQLLGSLPGANTDMVVIAYEPVWAIGTGRTPSLGEIEAMHRHIRGAVGRSTRILYGGSVKPSNAADILALPDVNGALVGGASLKAEDFFGIIQAASV